MFIHSYFVVSLTCISSENQPLVNGNIQLPIGNCLIIILHHTECNFEMRMKRMKVGKGVEQTRK